MLKYKKILVPYDGSDHAKKAVQQASDLAAAVMVRKYTSLRFAIWFLP